MRIIFLSLPGLNVGCTLKQITVKQQIYNSNDSTKASVPQRFLYASAIIFAAI